MTCNNCGELKLIEIRGVVEFIGCMCDRSGLVYAELGISPNVPCSNCLSQTPENVRHQDSEGVDIVSCPVCI